MDFGIKYYVIEFEKLPTEEHDKYVCVPRSWVLGFSSGDKIGFRYPLEKKSTVNKRIGEPPSEEWPMYMEAVKFKTDNYTSAKQFRRLMEKSYTKIRKHDSRANLKGNKTSAAKRRTRESRDSHDSEDDEYESEEEGDRIEEEQHTEQSTPQNKTPAKICRLDPRNKRRSIAGGSKDTQPADNPSSNTTSNNSDVIQTINTSLQQLLREMKNQNDNIEKLNQNFDVAREASLVSAVLLKEIAKKLMIDTDRLNIENSVTESKAQAAKQSQMITKRRRSVRLQEGQDVSEEAVTPKKQYIRPFSLPREYYEAKDSTWTLRYREMAPGLEELMRGTGVYIDSIRFSNCKRLARDEKTLARLLLVEIFTEQALGTCSLTGARAKAFDPDGSKTRPGLDERARNVLLNFVEEYCHEKRWVSSERQSIMNTLRNKMQEIRSRYIK